MARQANDSYPTPQPVARAVAQAVHELYPDKTSIIEPSAGSGVFVQEARQLWPYTTVITAIEKDERHKDALFGSGANLVYLCEFESWIQAAPAVPNQLVLGNPPFSLAESHISLMLDYLLPGTPICLLLKMNFLCSKRRAENFWPKRQLKYIRPFDTRPSFVKGPVADNDTNEYATFIWEVGYDGPATILFPHITWTKTSTKAIPSASQ